jgi:hypothetical protein
LEFAKYISSNNSDPQFPGVCQSGGTLTVVNGNICGRIYESGKEQHILQRWSWVKIRGNMGKSVVIVNTYRPVQSYGILSAYQQHKRVLLSSNVEECPRLNIMSSLTKQIQEWQTEGHNIILTGDLNEDVNSKNIRSFLGNLGMGDLVQKLHGSGAANTNINGSKPIDGIFGSSDITPV